MHDTADLETRGIPSVFVASSAFEDAAEIQGQALGYEPVYVLVTHPIQDRTDDEMRVLAEAAAPRLIAALTS